MARFFLVTPAGNRPDYKEAIEMAPEAERLGRGWIISQKFTGADGIERVVFWGRRGGWVSSIVETVRRGDLCDWKRPPGRNNPSAPFLAELPGETIAAVYASEAAALAAIRELPTLQEKQVVMEAEMPRESGRGLTAHEQQELDELRRIVEQKEAQLRFGPDVRRGGRPRGAAYEAARLFRSQGLRYPEDWVVSGEKVLAKFNQQTGQKLTLRQLRQRLYEDRKAADSQLSQKPSGNAGQKPPQKAARSQRGKKNRKSQTPSSAGTRPDVSRG